MKSVQEARAIILDSLAMQSVESQPLRQAFHRVLAEDVVAAQDVPAFDNTSMDGYAVVSADTLRASEAAQVRLSVSGEVSAGKMYSGTLKPGEAVRIMTGAPIPIGADAVVEQEVVRASNGFVEIGTVVQPGRNIRRKGEDVRAGTVIMHRGTFLRSAHLGVLASAGASSVQVYRTPSVAFLTTGNELVEIDSIPASGQIRNSNAYSLWGLIQEAGAEPVDIGTAKDDKHELSQKLREGLKQDVLITSGGVSVGAYDYVLKTLEELGVKQKFWKVNIKPGMPFFYGVYHDANRVVPVFGLPGNPVSTMVTFLQFVRPALQKMMGREDFEVVRLKAKIEHDIHKKATKRHFLRGIVRNEAGGLIVTTTGTQSSGALTSMAKANCFIVVPEDVTELKAGDEVGIELF
ncbi:MAG: molybdopterin molybdotransferase MoeA [Ignavibacteriae bacterium]|nr:molybdopterin molybdotransferase MoeA [Ignavibacteriota bacterium]